MRVLAALLCVVASVASSGCLVLSLQPAYDADSVAFEEALLGVWVNADDETQATIERAEWRSYKIVYKDRFASRTLQGNLTRIGDGAYLDVTEQRGNDPGPYLVPAHGIVRVDVHGDTMLAWLLDYGWFSRAIAEKSLSRLAASVDDRRDVVIAATTVDLRRWLTHVPAEALSAPMTFTRRR